MKTCTQINTLRRIAGLSLVELMVALVVSSILLLGVGTVYTASRQAYQTNDSFSAIQENARFALHKLAKNIRMSGYIGCRKLDSEGVVNRIEDPDSPGSSNPAYDLRLDNVMIGHRDNGNWTPALPFTPANIVASTDAISIRRASSCSQKVSVNMATNLSPVQVSNTINCKYDVDQPVIITNCQKTDVFMITSTSPVGADLELDHAATKNLTSDLSEPYTADNSFVMALFTTLYYIGTNGNGGTSLYEVTNGGNPVELVPDVESMIIRYGLNSNPDTDNSVDSILTADTLTAAQRESVINVYLRMLLVSEPIGNNLRPYTFDGVTHDGQGSNPNPIDSRYRKEFVTTINIRNRDVREIIK